MVPYFHWCRGDWFYGNGKVSFQRESVHQRDQRKTIKRGKDAVLYDSEERFI